MSDPRALLEALLGSGAHFIIVGGVAMVAHGASYLTEDLDVVYARDDDDIAALVRALAPLEPRLRVSGEPAGVSLVFDVKTLRNGMNFALLTTYGDLDLLGEIAGIGRYDDVASLSEPMTIEGREYQILSLEGLIRAKRAAGRTKDRQAIPELEHLLEIERMRPQE